MTMEEYERSIGIASAKTPFDPETTKLLKEDYYTPTPAKTSKNNISSVHGLPGVQYYDVPQLRGTSTSGFVYSPGDTEVTKKMSDVMFLNPSRTKEQEQGVIGHEAEHLLARRQLGSGSALNTKFDELMGGGDRYGRDKRYEFVNNAVKVAPYLKEKYGFEPDAYFHPKMVAFQGRLAPNLLYEQLASLSALEQKHNIDLTKDPELRKTLFSDPNVRETYNAITGLRQTRLDSKDISPYTRQSEPGFFDKLKKMMGYANGGYVPQAGNNKLI
jgi:hypothetical protein